MVVYPLDSELPALLSQVAAGYPVLVRFNEGRVWSEPRYAVVAGYNRNKQTVLLRAGMNRRRRSSDLATVDGLRHVQLGLEGCRGLGGLDPVADAVAGPGRSAALVDRRR